MKGMLSAATIINFLDGNDIFYKINGKTDVFVKSFCQLKEVSSGHILWIKNWTEEIRVNIEKHNNLIVVCKNDVIVEESENCYILCHDPKMVFFEIISEFYAEQNKLGNTIAETAVVKASKMGKNCSIGEFSIIGDEVEIGDDVIIEHHVTITGKVKIGNHCIVHSGCVIGKPGFGYYTAKDGHEKRVPHLGGVSIGNYVEIGSNSCVDRGTLGDTVIENYVKIDNLCHIAHNVFIGEDVVITGMSLLAGSSYIERNAYIAPGSLVMNQKKVGQDSFVGMGAVVVKDVPKGKVVAGVPAKVIRDNI